MFLRIQHFLRGGAGKKHGDELIHLRSPGRRHQKKETQGKKRIEDFITADVWKSLSLSVLNMIAQHELNWMRVQVKLPTEVWFVIFAHIVLEKYDRHNERDEAFMIHLDHFQKFMSIVL